MSNISDWSSIDDDNNKVPPDGWPEFQSPSSVNNCARAMMGASRRAYLEQPYFNPGGTIQYINSFTFSVADNAEVIDFTQFYTVGRRLKFVSPSGVVYGNVGSVRYGGGVAEIKCAIDGGEVINSKITAVYCGLEPVDTAEVIGRLPVGMILPYTAMSLPAGFLYADGNSFDPDIYTELAKIWKTGENTYLYGQEVVGGKYWVKTPDVRGKFPRYLDMGANIDPDGETRTIGETQLDAIRNISGVVASAFGGTAGGTQTGPFSYVDTNAFQDGGDGSDGEIIKTSNITFDASEAVPTADENRPINIAFPALIVAWHGVTPAENISTQDLLDAFNQMQESIDCIYDAKTEAVEDFNSEATNISSRAIATVNAVTTEAVNTVNSTTTEAVSTVNSATTEAIAEVSQKAQEITALGDSEVLKLQAEGVTQAELAQSWAVGNITEQPDGSAKYWAQSINPEQLADAELSNVTAPDEGFKNMSISWGMPDFTAGVDVTLPYTFHTEGMLWVGMISLENDIIYNLKVNGNNVGLCRGRQGRSPGDSNGYIYGSVGDTVTFEVSSWVRFYPLKGVI